MPFPSLLVIYLRNKITLEVGSLGVSSCLDGHRCAKVVRIHKRITISLENIENSDWRQSWQRVICLYWHVWHKQIYCKKKTSRKGYSKSRFLKNIWRLFFYFKFLLESWMYKEYVFVFVLCTHCTAHSGLIHVPVLEWSEKTIRRLIPSQSV